MRSTYITLQLGRNAELAKKLSTQKRKNLQQKLNEQLQVLVQNTF